MASEGISTFEILKLIWAMIVLSAYFGFCAGIFRVVMQLVIRWVNGK